MKHIILDPSYILPSEDWQEVCKKARERTTESLSWSEAFKMVLSEKLEELADEEEKPHFRAEKITKLMVEENDGDYFVYKGEKQLYAITVDSGITAPIPYSFYKKIMEAREGSLGYSEGIEGAPVEYRLVGF